MSTDRIIRHVVHPIHATRQCMSKRGHGGQVLGSSVFCRLNHNSQCWCRRNLVTRRSVSTPSTRNHQSFLSAVLAKSFSRGLKDRRSCATFAYLCVCLYCPLSTGLHKKLKRCHLLAARKVKASNSTLEGRAKQTKPQRALVAAEAASRGAAAHPGDGSNNRPPNAGNGLGAVNHGR